MLNFDHLFFLKELLSVADNPHEEVCKVRIIQQKLSSQQFIEQAAN
jgi:hypothetical protein